MGVDRGQIRSRHGADMGQPGIRPGRMWAV